jgi:hypothetical protein
MNIAEIKKAVRADLEKKDAKLQCIDFKHTVEISHQDGSSFLLHNAILERKWYGLCELLLVWTEHCGFFYFFVTDLNAWYKYKIV